MNNLNTINEVRILTIRQPFASLMLHGKIETRTWSTKYRGPVLIHAGLIPFKWNQVLEYSSTDQFDEMCDLFRHYNIDKYCGHAIAVGNLVDCRSMRKADETKAFVQWSSSLYSFVFEDVKSIVPFQIRGTQGFRRLTPVEIEKIEYSIEPCSKCGGKDFRTIPFGTYGHPITTCNDCYIKATHKNEQQSN